MPTSGLTETLGHGLRAGPGVAPLGLKCHVCPVLGCYASYSNSGASVSTHWGLEKSIYWELPWWRTVKNPPANAADTGSIPSQGTRSHMTPNNLAHALQQEKTRQ